MPVPSYPIARSLSSFQIMKNSLFRLFGMYTRILFHREDSQMWSRLYFTLTLDTPLSLNSSQGENQSIMNEHDMNFILTILIFCVCDKHCGFWYCCEASGFNFIFNLKKSLKNMKMFTIEYSFKQFPWIYSEIQYVSINVMLNVYDGCCEHLKRV